MVPRFTEFYIPVLKILEDTKEHEINQLIEEVAEFCNLTKTDREEMTRGGLNPRYSSNIQWAITDLSQGEFITRTARGVYKINFEGMLLLEVNPEHPTRDYLAKRSAKFRDFLTRKKPKRQSSLSDEGLFANSSDAEEIANTTVDTELLKDLKRLREQAKRFNLNTNEIDERIKRLEEKVILNRLQPVVEKVIDDLSSISDIKCGLYFDLFNRNPKVILSFDSKSSKGIVAPIELQFNDTENEQMEDASNENLLDNSIINKRSPSQPIKVYFDDGTVLETGPASNVFAQAIDYMGAPQVAALGIIVNRMNIVGKEKPLKYNYQQISDGYFVTTNLPNWRKKEILEKIGRQLGFKLVVRYSGDESES